MIEFEQAEEVEAAWQAHLKDKKKAEEAARKVREKRRAAWHSAKGHIATAVQIEQFAKVFWQCVLSLVSLWMAAGELPEHGEAEGSASMACHKKLPSIS